jgi:hypothetical protein
MLYKYLVMEGRYNFDEESADIMFASNDKTEAFQTAKDFGQGMVVISIDEKGSKQRIFNSPYKSDLAVRA